MSQIVMIFKILVTSLIAQGGLFVFENEQRLYIRIIDGTNFDLNLITAYNYITFNKPFPSITTWHDKLSGNENSSF